MLNSIENSSVPNKNAPAAGQVRLQVRPSENAAPAARKTQVSLKRITGFGPMARITTSFGEVHAHVLREGDMVRSSQGQFHKITKIDRIRLDEGFINRYPSVLPVNIRKGSIGPGLPVQDTMMAPYQKVRMGPPRTTSPIVFATKLLERPFVERATENQIIYTTFSVGRPISVYCEGLLADIDE